MTIMIEGTLAERAKVAAGYLEQETIAGWELARMTAETIYVRTGNPHTHADERAEGRVSAAEWAEAVTKEGRRRTFDRVLAGHYARTWRRYGEERLFNERGSEHSFHYHYELSKRAADDESVDVSGRQQTTVADLLEALSDPERRAELLADPEILEILQSAIDVEGKLKAELERAQKNIKRLVDERVDLVDEREVEKRDKAIERLKDKQHDLTVELQNVQLELKNIRQDSEVMTRVAARRYYEDVMQYLDRVHNALADVDKYVTKTQGELSDEDLPHVTQFVDGLIMQATMVNSKLGKELEFPFDK